MLYSSTIKTASRLISSIQSTQYNIVCGDIATTLDEACYKNQKSVTIDTTSWSETYPLISINTIIEELKTKGYDTSYEERVDNLTGKPNCFLTIDWSNVKADEFSMMFDDSLWGIQTKSGVTINDNTARH